MNRRELASWLTTPGELPETVDGRDQQYRGERLGLPESGPGSVAAVWRRVAALFVDWLSSLLVASFLGQLAGLTQGDVSLLALAIFAVQTTLLQWSTGSSFGQRILRIGVMRIDGGRLGILPLLLRTVLICLVLPPLVWDRDTRGLHDRAALTVCVSR